MKIMKVVLLAAGRSKRLKPIEDKNFLSFLGKPLIQRQLEQLASVGISRDRSLQKEDQSQIIVVGGKHNLKNLQKFARNSSYHVKIVEQKNLDDGMAGAILSVEKYVKNNDMLIVSAQDVVEAEAYQSLIQASRNYKNMDGFLVGKNVSSYFPGGYLKVKKNGLITGIVEKPGAGKEPGKMINLVIHYHRNTQNLFEALRKVKPHRDDWYETALDFLIKKNAKIKVVPYSGFWQAIKYPWHVLSVMDYFLEHVEDIFPHGRIGGRPAEVAASATIRGKNIYFEDGVRILDNAVIVGPAYIGKNTVIATNALVRESHIGDNCVIGFGSEIARSYLGNSVWTHTNYIGDSIIGNDVSFGSGTVTANLRLDEGTIRTLVQNEKIDTGLLKFGLVTGDHIRCGVNASFMPGIKVGHNCFIGGGITVNKDIPDNQYVYGKFELMMKENRARPNGKNRQGMQKKLI